MLDSPMMLQAKLAFVNRINLQSNTFGEGIERKVTGESNLDGNSDNLVYVRPSLWCCVLGQDTQLSQCTFQPSGYRLLKQIIPLWNWPCHDMG